MAVVPIWIDFYKMSTDFSFRGLMIPILSSIGAAVTIALARTKSTSVDDPSDDANPQPTPPPTRTTSGLTISTSDVNQ